MNRNEILNKMLDAGWSVKPLVTEKGTVRNFYVSPRDVYGSWVAVCIPKRGLAEVMSKCDGVTATRFVTLPDAVDIINSTINLSTWKGM